MQRRYLFPTEVGGESPANIVMDTAPDDRSGSYADVDGYDNIDFGQENTAIPEGVEPELAGKTREELLQEIALRNKAATEAQNRVDPIGALNQNFERFLTGTQPKPEVIEGWRNQKPSVPSVPQNPADIAAWKRTMADKFLDDPVGAQQELLNQSLLPILSQVAENQALQSREMALLSPDTKDIFQRYASEVEREVQGVSIQEKLQNPRVYQAAVERVKSRHMNELVGEQSKAMVDQLLADRLKELGIDPAILEKGGKVPQRPAAPSLASPGGQRPPASVPDRVSIRVTPVQKKMIEQKAAAYGVTPEAMAARMRERGEI